MRVSSLVTSGRSSLFAAESFLWLMFLCSLDYGWQGKLLQFWWGLLCHCGQWLLLCCSKGLSGSSLVALGIGFPQSLQYAGDTSPDVVCRLVSHCGSLLHYLRPGALSTCTVLGFLSSCDVILLQVVVVITVVAVCKGLLSCCGVLSNQVYLLIFLNFFFSFIYISLRLITLQYYSGFCYTLT